MSWLLVFVVGCVNSDRLGSAPDLLIGKRGLMAGDFVKPRAACFNQAGELVVVDFRAQIQVFDTDGRRVRGWTTPTHERGRPSGLAIDPQGRLAVADSHYHRVLFYDSDAKLVETLGGDDGDAPLVGTFGYVADIAFDRAGNLYLAEAQEREQITKISPEHKILKKWGSRGDKPGQFQRIRSLSFDQAEELYVVDACNHRVQVFSREGELLRVIGKRGTALGEFEYPYDLAICPDGNIVVCEFGNHRIQKLSREGKPIAVWGGVGKEPGQLFNPWAVAVSSAGAVFAIDSNNHRIQRFRF